MNEDKLSWLRGPLPPLSEAMKQSGILANTDIPVLTESPHQKIKKTDSKVDKTPKSKSRILSPKEQKPITTTQRSKSKIVPFTTVNPENFATYKPPPIEAQIGGTNKHVQHFEFPVVKERNTVKDDIQRLNSSLDETIRSLLPSGPMNDDEKFDFTMKLVRVHNFTMNELILLDKQVCSDRALLLRRLNTFYQEVIDDFPSYFTAYKDKIDILQQQNNSLVTSLTIANEKAKTFEEKIAELDQKISQLTQEKEILVNKSNDFDIDMQGLEEKNQMNESLVINLKYKLKLATEENEKTVESLKVSQKENADQLTVIEDYVNQLKAKEDKENAIMNNMRKVEARSKELEDINTQLNRDIYMMQNKELFDACVDTSDLKEKCGKMKKKRRTATNSSSSIPCILSSGQFGNECAMKRIIQFKEKEVQAVSEYSSIEVQTNKVNICDNEEEEDQKEGSKENEGPKEPATQAIDIEEELNKSEFNIDDIQFDPVPNYTLDEEAVNNIPNLFDMLVPFLGSSYKTSMYQELNKLNIGNMTGVKKQDKPLVWGLRIIHNFLTDPFIRSYEAMQLGNPESIFVEWLTRNYKLPHLVKQNCANISILIYTKRDEEELVELFADMMENSFSYTQICFLSLIYTFTVQFTFPSFTEMLQDVDLLPDHKKLLIHAKAAYKVIAKAMSPTIAECFMSDRKDPSHPMWNFIEFLRRSTLFFAEKHKQIFGRSRGILYLCEESDNCSTITYDAFNNFMALLDATEDHRHWYDAILSEKKQTAILSTDLIKICADRRRPLLEILRLEKIELSVKKLKGMKDSLKVLYWNFLKRYSVTIPTVLERAPASILEKTSDLVEKIKIDLLNIDLHSLLWHYRLFLSIIDNNMLSIVQEIPFQPESEDSVFTEIINFFDMTEKVSFALMSTD